MGFPRQRETERAKATCGGAIGRSDELEPRRRPKEGRQLACIANGTVIVPHDRGLRKLGGAACLPIGARGFVGLFIFFDRWETSELSVGSGIDVRSYPHIVLSTVTYLVDSEIIQWNSLARTAGRAGRVQLDGRLAGHCPFRTDSAGTAHDRLEALGHPELVALVAKDGETTPDLVHKVGRMPVLNDDSKTVRLIAGSLLAPICRFGPPVRCSTPMWRGRPERLCRSLPTTASGCSIPTPARSKLPAMCSARAVSRVPAKQSHNDTGPRRCSLHHAHW